MSAFAVIFERSGAPVGQGALDALMGRLSHRGPDGSDTWSAGDVAMGHWHFWTTPEERGERQPLELAGTPLRIVFDGRLDNREDLLASLGIGPAEGRETSDAALALRAYERWGDGCFARIVGPFAAVVHDGRAGKVTCARDALGDRTLFYSSTHERLVVASEPWAVAGFPGVDSSLDEAGAALHFAQKVPDDGRTLFSGVRELTQATALEVGVGAERTWEYWRADPTAEVRFKSDSEYAGRFRELLEDAVRCRLRSSAPAGVLMSGGLDSTSVACVAAPMVAPEPLTAVSYVFDELADCDEREYVDAVKGRWGLRSVQLPCDDLWPFKDWDGWPPNPNFPEGNMYRLLKERGYARARREGLRVLLTGGGGDHLYSGGAERSLAHLVAEKRVLEAAWELACQCRHLGVRRAASNAVRSIPRFRRAPGDGGKPPWLTRYAAELATVCGSGAGGAACRPGRPSLSVGPGIARSCAYEAYHPGRYALELRHPYRDRRLVEFMLAVPAHQRYRRGRYKHVLRAAMEGALPEVVRVRRRPTSVSSLYHRGLAREKARVESCVLGRDVAWARFVDAGWLSNHVEEAYGGRCAWSMAPWLCASFEAWRGLPSHGEGGRGRVSQ